MMEHSANFEKVRRYYVLHVWNITRVHNAVRTGWITEAEFTEITGEDY